MKTFSLYWWLVAAAAVALLLAPFVPAAEINFGSLRTNTSIADLDDVLVNWRSNTTYFARRVQFGYVRSQGSNSGAEMTRRILTNAPRLYEPKLYGLTTLAQTNVSYDADISPAGAGNGTLGGVNPFESVRADFFTVYDQLNVRQADFFATGILANVQYFLPRTNAQHGQVLTASVTADTNYATLYWSAPGGDGLTFSNGLTLKPSTASTLVFHDPALETDEGMIVGNGVVYIHALTLGENFIMPFGSPSAGDVLTAASESGSVQWASPTVTNIVGAGTVSVSSNNQGGWTITGVGGDGTPGGSSGAIQFVEGSSFAGTNRFTFDRTNEVLAVTGSGTYSGTLTVAGLPIVGTVRSNYITGSVKWVDCSAADTVVRFTNVLSSDVTLILTNIVAGAKVSVRAKATNAAVTVTLLCYGGSLNWVSTNATSAATNWYLAANKVGRLALEAGIDAGTTNVDLGAVTQP